MAGGIEAINFENDAQFPGGYPELHPIDLTKTYPPYRGPVHHGDGFTMRNVDDGVTYEQLESTDAYEMIRSTIDADKYPRLASLRRTSALSFAELQQANRERGGAWGKGIDISYLFNAAELGGEAGELLEAVLDAAQIAAATGKTMNAVKKYYRAEIGIAGGVPDLTAVAKELADVVICCSLLANKLQFDLGAAVVEKFNETSAKHGFPHRLVA